MLIKTTRFGEVDISSESILNFSDGMLGFEWCKRFVLLEDQPDTPFKWLQAVDDPEIAFVVVNPTDFLADYDIELSDDDAMELSLNSAEDAAILTTVTIDRNESQVTTNLLGPIVVNSSSLHAKQVVLQDDRYGTKHLIGIFTSSEAVLETSRAA